MGNNSSNLQKRSGESRNVNSSSDSLLTLQHLVIASTDEIDVLDWKSYLLSKWDLLVKENFRIVLLSGIHGEDDGEIGESDWEFHQEDEDAIEWLKGKSKYKDYIAEKNITFHLLDLDEYKSKDGSINVSRLGDRIRIMRPNLLLLTYCFSSISKLNSLLTSQGIYASLILQEDRMAITGQRQDFILSKALNYQKHR